MRTKYLILILLYSKFQQKNYGENKFNFKITNFI